MNNYVKRYFRNLNTMVDENPLLGLGVMITFIGSLLLMIYNVGKDFGDLLYTMLH